MRGEPVLYAGAITALIRNYLQRNGKLSGPSDRARQARMLAVHLSECGRLVSVSKRDLKE